MGTLCLLALGILIGKNEKRIRTFIGNVINDIQKDKS